MNSFDKIVQILRKPFPRVENWYSYFKILIIISLFVTFFLYVFQPFGISALESHKFLICLGFGSMTFLGALIYEFTVGQFLKLIGIRARWTFGKWILNNLGVAIFISFTNFLFIRILYFGFIQWELFPNMLYGTLMIGLVPIVVLGGVTLIKQEKKYQIIAEEINQKKTSTSNINNNHDLSIFDISASQIKYVEALQNYVKIAYMDGEDKLIVQTERATLKNILEEVEGSSIIKCHRSFLVNQEAIISTNGNAQGLLLSLSECDKIIPVSRSCVSIFRKS